MNQMFRPQLYIGFRPRIHSLPGHSSLQVPGKSPRSRRNSASPQPSKKSPSKSPSRSPSPCSSRSRSPSPIPSTSASPSPSPSPHHTPSPSPSSSPSREPSIDCLEEVFRNAVRSKKRYSTPGHELDGRAFRVLLLGANNVGKWSLVNSIVGHHSLVLKEEEKGLKKVMIQFEETLLELVFEMRTDNGDDVQSHVLQKEIILLDAMIVVFSVTDRRSFEITSQLLTTTTFGYMKVNPKLSVSLVGTKCDLIESRRVSSEQGRSLANCFQVDFFEVSLEDEALSQQLLQWLASRLKAKLEIKYNVEDRRTCLTNQTKRDTKRAHYFVRKLF